MRKLIRQEKLKVLDKAAGHVCHLHEVTRWLQNRLKCCNKVKRFNDYSKSSTVSQFWFDETQNNVIKTQYEGE